MSFSPYVKLQEKHKETEAELNETYRQLSYTQAQLQQEKTTNREMRDDVERATKRIANNLAKLELVEKKITYSDLFMQSKDGKCFKKDSDREVMALNHRLLQAVTILEQMQRSGKLQLCANPVEAPASTKEDSHCDCCEQKNKAGIVVQGGKVTKVAPVNSKQDSSSFLEKREADSSVRLHNRQLVNQLEAERKRRREVENESDELKAALKEQRKTIERLNENRRADPSANVDVNASVRARADSAFSQTRIKELEDIIAIKVDENSNLQKAVEKERQRADLNEKEINRVERDLRETKRQNDTEKNEELRELVREHFDDTAGPVNNVNVDVMKSYIRDLEGQIEKPDNSALLKRVDACIERVESLEKEKKGLKEYIVGVHKKLENQERETDLICKRLEYANQQKENCEIRRRESEQIAERMTEAKNTLQQEFDSFKRSVETGLGNLNQEIPEDAADLAAHERGAYDADDGDDADDADEEDFDLTVEDLENIDPSELEDFLKNF